MIGAGIFRSFIAQINQVKAAVLADLAAAGGSSLVSFIQTGVGAVLRTLQDRGRERISVKDFGAVGDGVADDSAAIQAAENEALARGAVSGRYPNVYFPAGTYMCNSLQWNKSASWVGEEVGNTRLVYNGPDNTAGTYVVGIVAGAGAVPYAGFYNMSIAGYDATAVGNPCAAHCVLNLGTNLDWGFKLENLHLNSCFDDALQLRGANSVFVNLFLNRIRFDAVGGFGIYIGSNNVNSGGPFVLDKFTLDNNLSANMITKMTAQGRYDGSRWGKGLIRIEDGQGVGAFISNARIELNRKLIAHNGGFAVIYSNQTVASARCIVRAENIHGTGRADQPLIFCRDVTGRTDFRWSGIGMSAYAKLFESATAERDAGRNQVGAGFIGSQSTQQYGLFVAGHTIEFRPNAPEQVAGNFGSYRFGDVVFNTIIGAGRPVAWQCKTPATGFGLANGNNITTTAVATAGSAVVGVAAGVLANLSVGLNVTLTGAGAAGADLATRIIAADEVANTVTLANNVGTSVNPCTIRNTQVAFAPVLYAPGMSADRGSVNVTLTLGVDAPTQLFNSPMAADKTVDFATSAANLGTVAQANGGKFRILRTAASTGVGLLNITHSAGVKALGPGQWADFEFNGTVWLMTAAGNAV